jgi:hypothetical protein
MNIPDVLLWGFLATIVLTTIMSAGQGLGFSRMSFTFILGSMVSSGRDRAMVIGFVIHMVLGWGAAIVYALIFESLHHAGWIVGGLLGLLHGLFLLVVGTVLLPALHPRMASPRQGPTPTRQLEPPGFLALNYGKGTPITTLSAHLCYGLILGACYSTPWALGTR